MQPNRLSLLIGFCFAFAIFVMSGALINVSDSSFALSLGNSALAQSKKKKTKSENPAPTPIKKSTIKTLPPAYGLQINRLSEVLGSLHYLRALCGANEGQKWRDEMQAMVTAEAPTKSQKEIMTARFNRGFRSYREIYRECTPAATQAAAEHLREGVKLALEIPTRFGN